MNEKVQPILEVISPRSATCDVCELRPGRRILMGPGGETWICDECSAEAEECMHHGAPRCRCGSRRTERVGRSALQRLCHSCGETYVYRLADGVLVPHAPLTALALDEERAR